MVIVNMLGSSFIIRLVGLIPHLIVRMRASRMGVSNDKLGEAAP